QSKLYAPRFVNFPHTIYVISDLVKELGKHKINILYGGTSIYFFDHLVMAAKCFDLEVRSILPFHLTSSKVDKDSAILMITLSIYERLMTMVYGCDAFLVLPGGYGTSMTVFTLATWAEMKFYTKPIGLLNFTNFFQILFGFLDEGMYQSFISPSEREIFKSSNTSSELMKKLQDSISTIQDSLYTMSNVLCFHCPFVGLGGCTDKGGKGLTKASLLVHLREKHFTGDARAITRETLTSNFNVFSAAEVTLKRMGHWLCGVCFKIPALRKQCRHSGGSDSVAPPDCGDGIVRFVLYDIPKPEPPCSAELVLARGLSQDPSCGFDVGLLDSLFSKGLRTVKSIPPKCRLGFSRVLIGALDKVICKPIDLSCWVSLLVLPICILKTFRPRSCLECKSGTKRQRQEESITAAIKSWGEPGGPMFLVRETLAEPSPSLVGVGDDDLDLVESSLRQCKRKICDGHYTAAVRVLSSSGVAPYTGATLEELQAKHPFSPPPSLPRLDVDCEAPSASTRVVLDSIRSFPRGTSCGRDGLRAQYFIDCLSGAAAAISDELICSITHVVNLFLGGECPEVLGEYIASAPLTPLVKPGGVTDSAESVFSLSPRQVALWKSQQGDHASDWLRAVPISGLGQTMNGKTYRAVLCYRLSVPLFSISRPCSACSRVFDGDIFGDHAVSCAGVVGIKHRHNLVRDTLSDVCFRSGISVGKEVDIGLLDAQDRPLRPADLLLYSWDRGLDVCVDLTGSSLLTQFGMSDFVPGRVVVDAAQRKRAKYDALCATKGYGFLPFSFSSLRELHTEAIGLLKRIQKYS
ncbi:Cytokinin riboside 5-monophosphate phosphoribohydrolase LOG3, partial [Striga hermonthica]